MDTLLVDVHTVEQLGEDWIQAIIGKDFGHIMALCHLDVKSTLLLPKRIDQLENSADLTGKVEDWFSEYDFIKKEYSRVAMVGEKLGIFYRFRCMESGGTDMIEQQLYCTIREGRIEQLRLICSGFQPDRASIDAPVADVLNTSPANLPSSSQTPPHADALLEFNADGQAGSTCAMLTPYIKSKLVGLSSGQVLEVHVNDISAKEDIEAWSRLSGNILLKMDQKADQGLIIYILKK